MRIVVLLCLGLACSGALATEVVFTRAELEARLRAAPVEATRHPAERRESMRKHVAAPPGDPVTEFALRRDVLAMELPLQASDAALLERVAQRVPSVYVWHEEPGHARFAEVAIDPAAAARYMLRESKSYALADALYAQAPEALSAPPDELARAARHLVSRVPDDELPVLAARLREAFAAGAPIESALATLAVRADDAALALHVFREGEASRLRRHVRELHDAFPEMQRELLEAGMQRDTLAPFVTALLGLHMSEDWARQALNDALANPALGATAAATLARHADDAQLAALSQRLVEGGIAAQNAALALRLSWNPYAQELLAAHCRQAQDAEACR